jgi:hypothetical protein
MQHLQMSQVLCHQDHSFISVRYAHVSLSVSNYKGKTSSHEVLAFSLQNKGPPPKKYSLHTEEGLCTQPLVTKSVIESNQAPRDRNELPCHSFRKGTRMTTDCPSWCGLHRIKGKPTVQGRFLHFDSTAPTTTQVCII